MYVKMRGQGRALRWSLGELGRGGSCEVGGWETAQLGARAEQFGSHVPFQMGEVIIF